MMLSSPHPDLLPSWFSTCKSIWENPVLRRRGILILAAFGLLLYGCGHLPVKTGKGPTAVMKKVAQNRLPRFSDDMGYDDIEHAIGKSLHYLKKLPSDKTFVFAEETFSRDHMIQSLDTFLTFIKTGPSPEALNRFISTRYQVYQSKGSDGKNTVLFTGYYEPLLSGSLTQSKKYACPIYAEPDDLITVDLSKFSSEYEGERIVGRMASRTLVPYYDRKEIDGKRALAGKAEILAWVSDPVDLFFLHIQGSGKISLENGQTLQVHYHSTNGRPYVSIGKGLIEKGKIEKEKMSMQAIREYLKQHPEEQEEILAGNPSYVFFQEEKDGPIGCLEEKLTAGRSLAVDRKTFPMAGLSFIKTQKPLLDEAGKIVKWVDCARFVLNQDTGGAIRGAGRADVFWGNGPYAEIAAGNMKQEGSLYFLVLKQ